MVPKRVRALLVGAIVAAFVAPLASTAHYQAEPCNGEITTYRIPEDDPEIILYADDRTEPVEDGLPGVPGITGGWWLYMETNGHNGLQTGGSHMVLGENVPSFIDACESTHGIANGPDAMVF